MTTWDNSWPVRDDCRLSILVAVVAFGVVAISVISAQTGYKSVAEELDLKPVEQPLPFSHKAHVALGVKCKDCHAIKDPGFAAGYPAEATCMACHAAIKTESPHIQKLAEFSKTEKPVPWEKIYRVPDYVWFSHASHVEDAAIACEHCHGPVAEREVLFKEKKTSMLACMECHAERSAPNDCNLCHDPG